MGVKASKTTESLISMLGAARRAFLGAMEGLTDEQFERRVGDHWSVRDILAHVAMWDEMELIEMHRSVRGSVSIFEHRFDRSLIDRWNEVQLSFRKDLPLTQVREDLRLAREDIIQFLGSLPEDSLTPFISTACAVQAKHDRDHAAQVREWRARESI